MGKIVISTRKGTSKAVLHLINSKSTNVLVRDATGILDN